MHGSGHWHTSDDGLEHRHLGGFIRQHLSSLYGAARADALYDRLYSIIAGYHFPPSTSVGGVSQRDAILITYGDQVRAPNEPPLRTLAGFLVHPNVGAVLAGYIVLMLSYTFVLKHVVLMDMMAIGAGFVLRAMAGAFAIDAPVSPWLYVVTALAALFLVIHKRRAELTLLEGGAGNHRPILDEYSPGLLDQMASLVTASTLISYGLYTFTAENLPENNAMMLTIPFVLYGLLRYLYLVHQKGEGGSPEEILLRDWPLLIDILLWVVTAATVLAVYRD